MAGQARRSTRRRGRPSRADSWPVLAVASAAVSGSTGTTSSPSVPTTRPETRATYRSLLLKGMAPEEAANLTAFLCGIQVGAARWKLNEVNRLLFLRELQQTGRFGAEDGAQAQ